MEPTIEPEHHIKKTNVTLAQAIIVAALLISGALVFAGTQGKESTVEHKVIVDDVGVSDFVRGNKNAEVTIIEYADFSCGFCARHHITLQKVIETYNGKVNWVYRHLPIFNKPAAIASSCVGILGSNDLFWKYSDILMQNQSSINQEYLKTEAVRLGVDAGAYETCINDERLINKINQDFSTTRILAGFNSTPYNVLVDKDGAMFPFSGALPYEDLTSLIDSMLEK